MEEDIIPFDRLGGSDLVAGSILAGGSAANYADEPIHHALPVGIQGGIRYSRLDGSVRLVVLYSTMSDEEWPDRLDATSGRLTYYGDNKVPGRPLLETTPGGNAMLAELDDLGLTTIDQRAAWPPFFVFSKTNLSGWSRRFEGVFVPDDTPGEPWLVPRTFDGPNGRFENFVLSLRRLDTKLVSRDWIDAVLAGDPCGPACPEEYRRWVESGSNAPPESTPDPSQSPGRVLGVQSRRVSKADANQPARGHAPSPVPALRRLIEQSLTVTDLAASKLWSVDPRGSAAEAAAMMAARRFDVAGVAADPITQFVTLNELSAVSAGSVHQVAADIPASLCVEQSLPLAQLLEHFRTREYVFVLDRDQVRWVVTRADLRAPAVGATILAYLVVIEEGLRRLVLDKTGDSWISMLEKKRRKSVRWRFKNLTEQRLEISLDLCATFGDWLGLARTIADVRRDLGFDDEDDFSSVTESFESLRNDLAHGRTIFDSAGIDAGLDRFRTIREFADQVWNQVDTLDQDWDVFATSVLEMNGSVIAGPDAAPLGWKKPVHVITAWNPGGTFWPTEENRAANEELASVLESRGMRFSPVLGRSPDGRWKEESLLVVGCSRGQAAEIGAAFAQRAIFELDSKHLTVVRCPDGKKMRRRPRASDG